MNVSVGDVVFSGEISDFLDEYGVLKEVKKGSLSNLIEKNAFKLSEENLKDPQKIENTALSWLQFMVNQNSLPENIHQQMELNRISTNFVRNPIASVSGILNATKLDSVISNNKGMAICKNLGSIIDSITGNGISNLVIFAPITRSTVSLEDWMKSDDVGSVRKQTNSEKVSTAINCAASVFEVINKIT